MKCVFDWVGQCILSSAIYQADKGIFSCHLLLISDIYKEPKICVFTYDHLNLPTDWTCLSTLSPAVLHFLLNYNFKKIRKRKTSNCIFRDLAHFTVLSFAYIVQLHRIYSTCLNNRAVAASICEFKSHCLINFTTALAVNRLNSSYVTKGTGHH